MTSETWNGHQQLRLPKFLCFWWRITSLMMTSLLSLASAPAGTAAGTTGLRVASCRLELFSFQHEPSQRCASRSVCPEKWIRCRWVISDRGLEKLKAPWNEFWRSCTRRTRNEEHIQLIYGWYTADIQLIYSWYTADIQLDWCSKVEICLDSLLILMPKLKPGAHAPSITNHALSLEHAAWQISLCLAKKKRLYALWAVPKAWVGWWLNGLWSQNIFGIIIAH